MPLTKTKAEILAYVAEAERCDVESRLLGAQAKEQELENIKLEREVAVHTASDYLHNHIVFDEEVDERTVGTFKAILRRMVRNNPDNKNVVVELNTPGGSIVDGFSMIDEILRLRRQGWHFTIRVQGQAASMGAVILQAADVREIGENSLLMIHRAAFGAIGKAYEIEDELEFVRKLEGKIAGIFSKASGRPVEDFHFLFDKRRDIWFDADEAVSNGLADKVN